MPFLTAAILKMGQALVTSKTVQKHQNIAVIAIFGVTLEFRIHRRIIWSESPHSSM